jgi:hypothetical protein
MLANARHETSLVFFIHALRLCCVHQSIHVVWCTGRTISIVIISREAAHTGASPCASIPLSFVVSSKRITPGKTASTFGTDMRSLARVQFGVALQVVESSEARLAGLAHKRLFLAVGEQMALEIMLAREFCRAIRASVFFR